MHRKYNNRLEPDSKRIYLIYIALILSTLLVFWQVKDFDFVNYDDHAYIRDNPYVLTGLTGESLNWAFKTCYLGYWQPLTWLSLMLDCQLFGPDPGWHHRINLLLHSVNVLLLFIIFRKTTNSLWPGVFIAAAFAIHPMHVESVVWISERKDVLSAFFGLLTLVAYADYVRRPSVYRYIVSLLLFGLGLMTKPMLVTLPLVLLLLDYWPLERIEMPGHIKKSSASQGMPSPGWQAVLVRLIIEKIPFLVLTVLSSVVTFLTQKAGGLIIDVQTLSLKERLVNAVLSYMTYFSKCFWPQNLAIFYPYNTQAVPLWRVMLYAALLIGVSCGVLRLAHNRKYLLVGWFWFIGTLVPVIGFIGFTESAWGDRFTYIPYIGLFIMVAWGAPELLSKWRYRKAFLGISMLILLTSMAVAAHRQTGIWRNSITLFTHALEVTQNNYLAYHNLGTAYADLGQYQKAAELFEKALHLKSDDAEINNNLGAAYYCMGRYQDAIEAYQQAIRVKPDYGRAYSNLGTVYGDLERYQEAVDAYQNAVQINPRDDKTYCNLGAVYFVLGDMSRAAEAFRQAIRINPDYAKPHFCLALVYLECSGKEAALEEYKMLKRLDPEMADQLLNLINQ